LMNLDLKRLGDIIKSTRIDRRLSQGGLAKMVGCHTSQIGQWEKGFRAPHLEDAFKIENALEMKDRPISNLIICSAYEKARVGFKNVAPAPNDGPKTDQKTGLKADLKAGLQAGEVQIPVELSLPQKLVLKLEWQ
jgi:transcriptional regulator with XRE-family HTH domain